MVAGVTPAPQPAAFAWARQVVLDAHDDASAFARLQASLPAPANPEHPAPDPTAGTGFDRAPLDGIALDRPFDMVPTILTNVVESLTGERDERSGRAISQILLAGQQLLQAGLRHAANGTGAIATGSSILGKVLPVIGIGSGLAQVWRGWNELESHDGGPLALLGSRTARTGMLQVLAGGLLFVPGVGPALAGAATRLLAAANEFDAFSFLDAPTTTLEDQGDDVAARVHVLDRTPTDPYDGVLAARAATA